ncbi:MAG: hypothetical protein NTV94_05850 [Planctomycetota bacterium]|nr:hypothetical protein [Planctomycetota bacterium]
MLQDNDDSWTARERLAARREPANAIELVVVLVFLCVFIGAAIGMSRFSGGMGAPGIFQLVPLGMAGVGVLLMVATVVRFSKRRQMQDQFQAAKEQQAEIERLELRTREAELQERMRRAAADSKKAIEPIVCAYCGTSRGPDELACGGCGSKRS